MIIEILTLSLALLSPQTTADETDGAWRGQTNSVNHSVEVIGIQTYQNNPTTPQDEYVAPLETAKDTNSMGEDAIAASAGVFLSKRAQESELVTINDVARLSIDGGNVSIQPSRGWAYVNKPVYLQSHTKPVTKKTTILGNAVTITATPVSYTWHCGDGHSFTTKDAGGTWEKGGTVTHSYTRSGTYILSAEIVWQASYTVGGHTYPVSGTLTTTSTTQQINIREAEAVLTY